MIRFFVPGIPQPKGSPKIIYLPSRLRPQLTLYQTTAQKRWAKTVTEAVRHFAPAKPLDGPLDLELTFVLPHNATSRRKKRRLHCTTPDLDKLVRSVCDALEKGGVIANDSRIASFMVDKRYQADGEEPGVFVDVKELAE
jgi:Holliday junction resolvase RusA-like endonuclease